MKGLEDKEMETGNQAKNSLVKNVKTKKSSKKNSGKTVVKVIMKQKKKASARKAEKAPKHVKAIPTDKTVSKTLNVGAIQNSAALRRSPRKISTAV